jgi:hypothetical protein
MMGDTWENLTTILQESQKFVISKEIAEIADGLSTNEDQLTKLINLCRLPFPTIWAEVVHADRPHFKNANRPLLQHEQVPTRVGVLLRQLSNTQFLASLFWNFPKDKFATCSLFDCHVDMTAGVGIPVFCKFWNNGIKIIEKRNGIAKAQELIEAAKYDWPGEIPFWLAILALTNSRNAVELKTVDNTAWNEKRTRKGQEPFVSYRECNLRVPKAMQVQTTSGKTGHGHSKALHIVSGHLKVRKTGIYWWNSFWRGDANLGTVTKVRKLEKN